MTKTFADIRAGTLRQIGVEYVYELIGDSLNALADAIRRSSIAWIGVLREGAALAGAGQARLTGRLAVRRDERSRHDPPAGWPYEAGRHAPVLALPGNMRCDPHCMDHVRTAGRRPAFSLAIPLGIDKFMGPYRALTSLMGDGVATVVASDREGKLNRDQLEGAMAHRVDLAKRSVPVDRTLRAR